MWKRGLFVALVTAALGGLLWSEQEKIPLIREVDGAFQEWLTANSPARSHPPVPVTIVEMEDAASWRALDYALFLRAFPARTDAVVVLESLPAAEETAYYRSFANLALKQPRLLLPVELSQKPGSDGALDWWKGLPVVGGFQKEPVFASVESAPGEELRSIISTGGWDTRPATPPTLPLYYRLAGKAVPSLALEAILLAWHIPAGEVLISPGVAVDISGAECPVDAEGNLLVDTSLLPGLRHVKSSDLLLQLDAQAVGDTRLETPPANLENGVILLGDVSTRARIYRDARGQAFSRVELLGAAIATMSHGLVRGRVFHGWDGLLIGVCSLFAGLFALQRDDLRSTLLLVATAFFFWAAVQVAQSLRLALPLSLPVTLLLTGWFIAEMGGRLSRPKSDGKSQP